MVLKSIQLVLSLAMVWQTSVSAGELHKWVDEKGQVHYSQVKPNDINTESTMLRRYKNTPAAATKPEEDAAKPATTPEKPEDLSKLSNEQLKKRNCDKAKSYLSSLQQQGDIAITGADGKLETLKGKARDTAIDKAKGHVSQFCGT